MEVDLPPIDPALEPASAAPPATGSQVPSSSAAIPPSSEYDPDPIIASYDVYTNPSLPADRQLLIMQHPNQRQPSVEGYTNLSEVRIKPRNQMIEVDVPLSYHLSDYDRDKGLRWGTALSRSMAAKNGGTHGLAGGFGVGAPAMRGGAAAAKRRNADEVDLDLLDTRDWSEAVRQDRVLRTQTLGGSFPVEGESHCRWMVGIFQGKQLHLTPATALINLRPQLHHIDATTEQERLSRPREGGGPGGPSGAGPSTSSGGGGAGKDSATTPAPPPPAARAITMTIKSASGNEVTTETMTDRLRFAQQEPWSKLKYEDDSSNRAWDMFSQNLVYKGPGAVDYDGGASSGDAEDKTKTKIKTSAADTAKGQSKAAAATGADGEAMDVDGDDDGSKNAEGKNTAADPTPPPPPQLRGKWATTDFLKAVSGMQEGDGAEADRTHEDIVEIKKEAGAAAAIASSSSATAKPKASAVARKASATASGKGKSVAFE
ncbi:Sin-like protein conserved region-domain-containing protein [Microdochium trichocladiopsis]|uniref:Sin-like protein conserved region-domain-containing protein n=1 Tax=Microdochium trichocladiopsis TaxID=1682393 RepID=A0A9P8YEX3_9PEZI|nr:Sin-like protein conserved region-domain-containing protein [Microdochium trichocladiopsis]KAH7035696.1 Sin-like protein conserved region-domain-containing protein [Microdochium trichocladiopsis]